MSLAVPIGTVPIGTVPIGTVPISWTTELHVAQAPSTLGREVRTVSCLVSDGALIGSAGFDISAGLERAPRAQILATACPQRRLEDRVTAR